MVHVFFIGFAGPWVFVTTLLYFFVRQMLTTYAIGVVRKILDGLLLFVSQHTNIGKYLPFARMRSFSPWFVDFVAHLSISSLAFMDFSLKFDNVLPSFKTNFLESFRLTPKFSSITSALIWIPSPSQVLNAGSASINSLGSNIQQKVIEWSSSRIFRVNFLSAAWYSFSRNNGKIDAPHTVLPSDLMKQDFLTLVQPTTRGFDEEAVESALMDLLLKKVKTESVPGFLSKTKIIDGNYAIKAANGISADWNEAVAPTLDAIRVYASKMQATQSLTYYELIAACFFSPESENIKQSIFKPGNQTATQIAELIKSNVPVGKENLANFYLNSENIIVNGENFSAVAKAEERVLLVCLYQILHTAEISIELIKGVTAESRDVLKKSCETILENLNYFGMVTTMQHGLKGAADNAAGGLSYALEVTNSLVKEYPKTTAVSATLLTASAALGIFGYLRGWFSSKNTRHNLATNSGLESESRKRSYSIRSQASGETSDVATSQATTSSRKYLRLNLSENETEQAKYNYSVVMKEDHVIHILVRGFHSRWLRKRVQMLAELPNEHEGNIFADKTFNARDLLQSFASPSEEDKDFFNGIIEEPLIDSPLFEGYFTLEEANDFGFARPEQMKAYFEIMFLCDLAAHLERKL